MDLWQLKVFVSVVEHKSFSKASASINLSQPTVSSHIKELENYFDCRLLDRLGKTTEPTKAGEILYSFATQILDLKEKAESSLFDFLGNAKGLLTIGGSTIPSGFILPKLIGLFSSQFPDVSIQLTSGDTMQIASQIISGKIEAGIIGAKIDRPEVDQTKLLADEMMLIVPSDHPWGTRQAVGVEEILKEKIIAREKGSGTWKSILKNFSDAGIDSGRIQPAVTMGSTTSVIQGILNGVGISILSTIAVKDDLEKGRLKALSINNLHFGRHFYLTVNRKRALSPICKKFIQFAKNFYQHGRP